MKMELKEALRLIGKVQTDPRVGPGERDRLHRARRELEKMARSGKLDRKKLFLAIEIIVAILKDAIEDRASP